MGRTVRVTLEVDGRRAPGEAVSRLVQDAARRVFDMDDEAAEVEVWSRTGALLGRDARDAAPAPPVAIAPSLLEPHVRPRRGPDLSRHPMREEYGEPVDRDDQAPGRRSYDEGADTDGAPATFAETLDLAPSIRGRVGDGDVASVVQAILEAAGHRVELHDGLLVAGPVVICVLQPGQGNVVCLEQLSGAFLRIRDARARRGLVVCPGVVDLDDLRRREILAPDVVHIGPEDVQRMADAAALGGDPLGFAVEPDLRIA